MARRSSSFLAGLLAVVLAAAILSACSSESDPRIEALKIETDAHRIALEGHHAEAIAEYSRAIAVDPGIALIYHQRGVSYGWIGDYQTAIADFDKALELDPARPFTYYERGATYYRLADFSRAEQDLQTALDMTSDPDLTSPAMRLLASIRTGDAAIDAAAR